MKQKIKIMKHKQQPSDEEIQSYMNFDRLLDSRKVALSSTRPMSVLKWSIPILTVATLTGWYLLVKDNAPVRKNKLPTLAACSQHCRLPLQAIHQKMNVRPASTTVEDEIKQAAEAKISKRNSETPV